MDGEKSEEPLNYEAVLALGLKNGLTMADSKEMTIGAWMDYVIEVDNMNYTCESEEDGIRDATPEDIQRLKAM